MANEEPIRTNQALSKALGLGERPLDQVGAVAAQRVKGYFAVEERDSVDGEWADPGMLRGHATAVRVHVGAPGANGKMQFATLEHDYPVPEKVASSFAREHGAFFGPDARLYVEAHRGDFKALQQSTRGDAPSRRGAQFHDYDKHGESGTSGGSEALEESGADIEDDGDEDIARRGGAADVEPSVGGAQSRTQTRSALSSRKLGRVARSGQTTTRKMRDQPAPRMEFKRQQLRELIDGPAAPTNATTEPEMAKSPRTAAKSSLEDLAKEGATIKAVGSEEPVLGNVISVPPEKLAALKGGATSQVKRWERAMQDDQYEQWQHITIRKTKEGHPELNRANARTVAAVIADDWKHVERVSDHRPNEQLTEVKLQDGSRQVGIVTQGPKGPRRDGKWLSLTPDGEVSEVASFQDGKLHGSVKEYGEGRKLVSRTEYRDGLPHGMGFKYNEQGYAIQKTTYENGVEVRQEELSGKPPEAQRPKGPIADIR